MQNHKPFHLIYGAKCADTLQNTFPVVLGEFWKCLYQFCGFWLVTVWICVAAGRDPFKASPHQPAQSFEEKVTTEHVTRVIETPRIPKKWLFDTRMVQKHRNTFQQHPISLRIVK